MRDTATSTSVVGSNVLNRADTDSSATFLPSLPISGTKISIEALPSGVNRSLHQHSTSSSSSNAAAETKDNIERVSEGDEDDEEDEVEGSSSSATGRGQAAKQKPKKKKKKLEELLQESYNVLLPHLLRILPSSLHFHDTHLRGYLTCPTGKIDVTFTASDILTWPNVVTFLEFKHSLLRKPAYEEAVGQVIQRCLDIFDKQDQRQFIIAAVMDGMRIDILRVQRHAPVLVTHTGLQPFSLSLDSIGWKLLMRLLCAPSSALGFTAPLVPDPFELTPLVATEPVVRSSVRHNKLSSMVQEFIALRVGSPRVSAVFQARCGLWPETPIVIKFSPEHEIGEAALSSEVNRELKILRQLQTGSGCPYIPRLLAHGKLPHPIHHLCYYLVIQPYGEHLPLSADDSAVLVCRVLRNVCEAMQYAYVHHRRLLHRDISYGNIVHSKGVGYLIDWHVAYPEQATAFTDRITGTPLFSGHRLHFRYHAHCLMDDLESLLYVLIYVATGSWLPWAHSPPKLMDALKKWHLTEMEHVQELLNRCVMSLRPVIDQLRLIIFFPYLVVSSSTALSNSSSTSCTTPSIAISPSPSLQPAIDDLTLGPFLQFISVLQQAEATLA